MAALSADVPYGMIFDPRYEIGLTQFKCTAADIFYRGGLSFTIGATGLLTATPAATADFFAGVNAEHRTTTAANELVWVATTGKFWFAATTLTDANRGKQFAQAAAALFDNPADIVVSVAGTTSAIGQLTVVDDTAVSGWVDTTRRITDENL